MRRAADFLMSVRRIGKLHDAMLKEISGQYQLTLIEAQIIRFLSNNPGKDTAGDIVELRMLSKGNVSQAVESLIQKSLLKRVADSSDRRKIHLFLLPDAEPIVAQMGSAWNQLQEELFEGLMPEEREQFMKLNERVLNNTKNAMKRRGMQ